MYGQTATRRRQQPQVPREKTDFREGAAIGSVVLQPAALRRRISVFEMLTDDELVKLAACLDIVEYKAGDTVFVEEGKPDFLGFVISGRYLITKENGFRKRQVILANIGEGSIVGEYSMIEGLPRTASATAIESGRLIIMHRDAINRYMDSNPEAGVKIMRGVLRAVSLRHIKTAERLLSFF